MPSQATIRAMKEAVAHHQAGRAGEAERIYRSVLREDPSDADALNLLGLLHYQSGHFNEAHDLMSRAIAIRPEPHFYVNLSQAQRMLGRVRESLESCRKAVQRGPRLFEAWNNLGSLLQQTGQPLEALSAIQKAIEIQPRFPMAYNNLGNACVRLGRIEEAMGAFNHAMELDPKYVPPYVNLANLLSNAGRLDESIALCHRALALDARTPAAYANLGVALHTQGRFEEGNDAFLRGIQLGPQQPRIAENWMAGMSYSSRSSAAEIMQAHVQWANRFADPLAPPTAPTSFSNDRSPDRRLRIGYLSADLKRHSVAYFLEPLLEHHDRSQFEITAYSNTEGADDVTTRLRGLCDRWQDIVPLTDDEVAAMIRADGIDIVVELGGHTVGNRLLALARQPAPIQVTYLGYPATTGMRAIDYRIVDALTDPPGSADAVHTEKLWRVAAPFIRYRPPVEAPAVVAPPMVERGQVTFGSFNKTAKAGAETIALWSDVLRAVPNSCLIMKSVGLRSEGARKRLFDGFTSHGVDFHRVELVEARQSLAEHLGMYGQIDVALDTFPYHGTTTTCEALWMGVPVISLAGTAHVSRVGVSLLRAIGEPGWVATSAAAYVQAAVELTRDAAKLGELRGGLRERVRQSSLCDAAGLARSLESAYRQMFAAWAISAQ